MPVFQFDPSDATTINVGALDAPHQLTVFANLVCPNTRRWWQNNRSTLVREVTDKQLHVQLKFWNQPQTALVNGNLAQAYIDYQHPKQALRFIEAILQDQDDLRMLDPWEVEPYLQGRYHVQPFVAATSIATLIDQEVRTTGVVTVPTLFLDDQKFTARSLPRLQGKL